MPLSFSAGVRDSLSNLAASLGVGRDKAVHDAFGLRTLERVQIEAMYGLIVPTRKSSGWHEVCVPAL
ncbi:MAG: hypothetical protein ACRYGP_22200 [Janthinobacterium lividum]